MTDRTNFLLVVAYGVGLDSTAMLVEMHNRGERPDIILFSDTGAEKPETYAYLDAIRPWLLKVGFPDVTIVSYKPVRANYTTLEGKCLENEVLPSLVMGQHQCALVFKRDTQVKYLRNCQLVIDTLAAGGRLIQAIGYDDGARDRKRSEKAAKLHTRVRGQIAERAAKGKAPLADQWQIASSDFIYPLQDWGLAREELAGVIEAAGLPVPPKSACFFCPATKPSEVVELKNTHPDLYERALNIERTARNGKHGEKTLPGLGMGGWSWEWLADVTDPAEAAAVLKARGAKVKDGARP